MRRRVPVDWQKVNDRALVVFLVLATVAAVVLVAIAIIGARRGL